MISKPRLVSVAFLILLAASHEALADGVDPAQPLPPGHPSVTAPTASADPEQPGTQAGEPLPAGHPAMPPREPPQDRATPAGDLRPGTIEVHIHDGSDNPIAGAPVRLGIMKQDVAEGDSRSERTATTDVRGVAVFEGLAIGTAYSYRVTVQRDPAAFASEPLRLSETGGERVLLHVYPVTRDLREALVGARGVLFIQPREDVFQVEESFQILNIGTNAWVPADVHFQLPDGAKAFRAGEGMTDARFERSPSGNVELHGTFSPGQHDVSFQFQLDNRHDRRRSFRLALPPHVAELRVVSEGGRDLVLTADGFPESEPMRGQDGSRLLVTGRHLVRGDAPLEVIDVTLDNLPVPSSGRWYAVATAVCFAALGLWKALGRRGSGERARGQAEDRRGAEKLVLDELVALEKLRRDDAVGPRTYQETRSTLLGALARLHAADSS